MLVVSKIAGQLLLSIQETYNLSMKRTVVPRLSIFNLLMLVPVQIRGQLTPLLMVSILLSLKWIAIGSLLNSKITLSGMLSCQGANPVQLASSRPSTGLIIAM